MILGLPFPVDTVGNTSQIYGVNPAAYAAFPSLPYHNGADIAVAEGTPVLAVADGQVVRVAWDPGGYGTWVETQHAGFATRYAHGIRGGYTVPAGADVAAGTRLMEADSTGNSSGHHVHLEIRTRDPVLGRSVAHYMSPSGRYVIDPFPYLPEPYGDGRQIGANVNDETLLLDEIVRLEQGLRMQTIKADKAHARKMELLVAFELAMREASGARQAIQSRRTDLLKREMVKRLVVATEEVEKVLAEEFARG